MEMTKIFNHVLLVLYKFFILKIDKCIVTLANFKIFWTKN
jgi:hypothetical protein